MDLDFGRYVIGTNSWNTNWLSCRLDEPQWISLDLQVERAVSTLTDNEREVWELFLRADKYFKREEFNRKLDGPRSGAASPDDDNPGSPNKIQEARDHIRELFLKMLSKKKRGLFAPLMDAISCDSRGRLPPKFNLKLVQRYVVGRVFELGWTPELFEKFDQRQSSSRQTVAKAERIGKKYQWIAYHEMLAFMADHYQYVADQRSKNLGIAYQGSWQDKVRDIDPSNVMLALSYDEDESPTPSGFWTPKGIQDWHGRLNAKSWARLKDDIPQPGNFLFSRDQPSNSEWVNLRTHLKWTMPRPADEDSFKDGRRDVWMDADGALVRRGDIQKLKSKKVADAIFSHGIQSGGLRTIFLGEIGWSDASTFFDDPYFAHLGWAADVDPDVISATAVSQAYSRERGGLDCSVTSDTVMLNVPTARMLDLLKAQWSGISATYVDEKDVVVAFDPSPNVPGPSAFLVRRDRLHNILIAHDLVVCWAIQGEKTDAEGAPDYDVNARRSFSGLFIWDGVTIEGQYSFEQVEFKD